MSPTQEYTVTSQVALTYGRNSGDVSADLLRYGEQLINNDEPSEEKVCCRVNLDSNKPIFEEPTIRNVINLSELEKYEQRKNGKYMSISLSTFQSIIKKKGIV
ncbi:Hypothetical protein CINCED_3A012904 [Cinara cedri]|uniref:Uncharacterized protein n=1 Tax=Cinara cedri TaxID=506608 RepID=A0A5E4NCJ4_9HEMI|nr:Hypothetical protein CINCED_3A012904 [Cinara cedri]